MLKKDATYLTRLRDYYAQHRIFPSFAAIGQVLGLRSSSSVAALAKRLQAEGFLEPGPGGRLAPGARFFERELADTIKAGLPAAANQATSELVTIDEHLVRVPSRTVLLTVKGDSMLDAGLLPGDTVIVEKGAPAKVGDIVVAIVDNEFTVKYLEMDKKTQAFYLKAGNPAYAPIKPKTSLELYGKVVGAFRRYG